MMRIASAVFLASGLLAPGCSGNVNDGGVQLAATVRASFGAAGVQGNGDCEVEHCGISSDGRYITFTSESSNVVPGDTNGKKDVFRRDMVSGETVLISVSTAPGVPANADSKRSSISGDGRYVAFETAATDVPDAPASTDPGFGFVQIYVRDVQAGTTTCVSRAPGPIGDRATGNCRYGVLSADGRYVAFETFGNNVDGTPAGAPDNDAVTDIYRRDYLGVGNTTLLISVSTAGVKATAHSRQPSISDTGQFVAFESDAANLVTVTPGENGPDGNAFTDVFRRQVTNDTTGAGNTVRCSVGAIVTTQSPPNPDNTCDHAEISGDGQFVIFRANASNLHVADDGTESDIFARDVANGVTTIISVHSSGSQAGSSCAHPNVSQDGRFVVFQSGSSNLVNGDSNNVIDCFMHDAVTGATTRVSVGTFGTEANVDSQRPRISRDGRFVVFVTDATNLADDDTNGVLDVYRRGPLR